ncbi:hypothetical protein FRC03_009364 [Tulasnella sp. 419]|nr:hypothetical protein FRC02_010946 [Tulasnella sp. 418]KAG8958200.1 hypothetical protein FRC03_009364 [Tulasnella sp. 419]
MFNDHTSPAPMITHLCQVCGTKTSYWCSRCHSVWYCSVEHMQFDWVTHRQYCRPHEEYPQSSVQSPAGYSNPHFQPSSMTKMENPSYSPTSGASYPAHQQHYIAPTPNPSTPTASFDALLFPHDEERPRIVRIQCTAQPQPSGPTIWTPLPQEYVGVPEISGHVVTHGIGGAQLRFPLQLFYGANSFTDGSPINRVIHRMTGGKSTCPWAGNLLALKFSGSRRQGYTDATYNDVAPLIASFLARQQSGAS